MVQNWTTETMLPRFVSYIQKYSQQIVICAIIFTILAGSMYSVYLGEELRFLPDESDYFTLAHNIAEKSFYSLDGQNATAYRAPGYPFLLSLFYKLGARVTQFRILNFIWLGASIYLVYRILLEMSSRLAASLGAILVLGYPVVFFTAGTLYPQMLATLFFLLVCFFVTRNSPRAIDTLLAGLFLGALILTVPTFIFIVSVIGVWAWYQRRKISLKGLSLGILSLVLLLGIWTARNYLAFDSLVFVTTNSGENLLLGNSENTTPNGGSGVDISKYVAGTRTMDEVERDHYYRQQAWEYIWTHKIKSLKMYGLKLLNYFNFRNDLVTSGEESRFKDILMLVTYYPLLGIMIGRSVLFKKYPFTSFEVLWIVLYLGSALTSAIFFTRIRFRIPFDFLLILLCALFLERILRQAGYLSLHEGSI